MASIDFNDQADPVMLLLQNATTTQTLELGIQGGVSNVLQSWSDGATDSIDAGNNLLSADAAAMQGLTGDALTQANAQYQEDQTRVSNINNQYSNVMQGGGTALTSLTDVESQNLQFCAITAENQDNTNNLIMSWGN